MVKISSHLTSSCRETHGSSVRTNRQTNRQTDPNEILSPLARIMINIKFVKTSLYNIWPIIKMEARTLDRARGIQNMMRTVSRLQPTLGISRLSQDSSVGRMFTIKLPCLDSIPDWHLTILHSLSFPPKCHPKAVPARGITACE